MAKTRTLNRTKVVEAAVHMAREAGGIHDLTLAKLAAELGIKTPSLYNHITSIQDLHQAIAIWGFNELLKRLQSAQSGLIGRPALEAVAHAARQYARDWASIYELTLQAPQPDAAEHLAVSNQLVQLILLLFASCGLQGDQALHAVRGLRSLIHGFASLEQAGGFGLDLSMDDSYALLLDSYLNGLGC